MSNEALSDNELEAQEEAHFVSNRFGNLWDLFSQGPWTRHSSSRHYSHLPEVLEDQFQNESGDLPNLLQTFRQQQGGRINNNEFAHATLGLLLGEVVVFNGEAGWTVIASRADTCTCEINHPIFGTKIGIPQSDVERGLREQIARGQRDLDAVRSLLPGWAFHEDIVQKSYGAGIDCDWLSLIVGPCVPVVRALVLLTFVIQLSALAIGNATGVCSENGRVTFPTWVWLAMLPLLSLRAFAEFWTLTYVLSYAGRYTEAFRIAGLKVPFELWLGFSGFVSSCNFCDIFLDSISTVAILKAFNCTSSVARMWTQLWEQSMPRGILKLDLQSIVLLAWSFSLVQIVVPLFRTLRLSDIRCETQHAVGRPNPNNAALVGSVQLSHDAVVFGLADAAGMATLHWLAADDADRAINSYLKRTREDLTMPIDVDNSLMPPELQTLVAQHASDGYGADITITDICPIFDVEHLSSQMLDRVLWTWILETCVQANIQSTSYAMSIATMRLADKEHFQVLQLLSIITSGVCYLLRFFEMWQFFQLVSKVLQLSARHAHMWNDATNRCLCRIRWKSVLVGIGSLVTLPCMVYAGAKVVMAHVCTDAVWSVTGCVNFHV